MTAQIIFPKEITYWILTDGVSYFDGFTSPDTVTTVGSGTQIFWIGTDHAEYVQACLDLGLTPRNTGTAPVISVRSDTPVLQLDQRISELNSKLSEIETVIPGQRISARQARLWLIQRGVDLDNIDIIIDSIEDLITRQIVKTEWEYAPYIERNHLWLNNLASVLGLESNDLDRAFEEAVHL